MSMTKRNSEDGVGGRDPYYEEWSDGLPLLTDEDLRQMALEDELARLHAGEKGYEDYKY